jgi:hypothetical protein
MSCLAWSGAIALVFTPFAIVIHLGLTTEARARLLTAELPLSKAIVPFILVPFTLILIFAAALLWAHDLLQSFLQSRPKRPSDAEPPWQSQSGMTA